MHEFIVILFYACALNKFNVIILFDKFSITFLKNAQHKEENTINGMYVIFLSKLITR